MHIRPTRFLEVDLSNIKYNLEGRLCKKCTDTDWSDDDKTKEVITADNNKNNNKEDFREKN